MPTYDYGCDACGAEWEVEQRITADPIKKCPKCKKMKAKRLITGSNFILKGGGWYSDLYSSPNPAAKKRGSSSEGASSSSSSDSSTASDSSSSSSETKSASETKTESKPKKAKKASGG